VPPFAFRLFSRDPRLDGLTDRVRVQQLDLLFKNVGPGVAGAGFASVALAGTLLHLQVLGALKAFGWSGYILACMAAHLGLLHGYRKARVGEANWRPWALGFTLISLLEGIGWGFAPVALDDSGRPEIGLFVLCVTLVVTCGSVAAYGSYLPAFFVLFFPASLPFAFFAAFSRDPVLHAGVYLMPIYLVFLPILAVLASRNFQELVTLRLKSGELAEHLRSQIELVEQAMIAKSNFLAAASHDLRQPVHAIGLFAGALRELALPEAARRLTGQIENSVSALDGLFAALLDISRLDAGSVEVRRSAFPVHALIERVAQDFVAEAAAKGVAMRWVACSARVRADPILLERILRNLVANAVRYTPKGRVLVGCRRRAGSVEIQVCDTGLGIAPEHRELIFKEYFQLHNPERDRQKGLGLGLAIVQRLARLLESPLSLRSQIGRGSCFALTVPLAQADAATLEASLEPPAFGRERALIIVIDDEAPILAGMTTLLTGWGYDVIGGDSGEAVVAQLARCPLRPDLIISDQRLRAEETGLGVIERLRTEYNEEIPAILMSGDTGGELREEARACNAVLLHKPMTYGKLRAAISHSLAGQDSAQGPRLSRAPTPLAR
jgi:signal transduction histidine kinase/CheY-like chemotaxis protein